jgi:hypothetical protein
MQEAKAKRHLAQLSQTMKPEIFGSKILASTPEALVKDSLAIKPCTELILNNTLQQGTQILVLDQASPYSLTTVKR